MDNGLLNNAWYMTILYLLSGALSVVISTSCYQKYENRKIKIDCFRRLIGARYVITSGEHSAEAMAMFYIALNESVVIFSDTPSVILALKNLHSDLKLPDRFNDNIVTLFRSMADSLDINRDTLNDSFFLKPFTPNK